jgi:DNA adenine methylase
MLSNSDTPFIRELYRDFPIHTVRARRAINCDGSKRGAVNEVVVLSGI